MGGSVGVALRLAGGGSLLNECRLLMRSRRLGGNMRDVRGDGGRSRWHADCGRRDTMGTAPSLDSSSGGNLGSQLELRLLESLALEWRMEYPSRSDSVSSSMLRTEGEYVGEEFRIFCC